MLKPVVFALSMTLGGAAFALAVSVQRDRTTLTSSPAPLPPLLERTTQPLVLVESALPAHADEPVVEMDEVEISAQRSAVRSLKVRENTGFQPCSEWRDLGPKALADSLDADQHRVRALCPPQP